MGDRDPDTQEEGSCLPLSFAATHSRSLYRPVNDQTSDQIEPSLEEEGQASEVEEEALALEQGEGQVSELEVEEALAEQVESDYHRREEVEDRLAHRSTALRPTSTQNHVDLFCHVEQVISTCYGADCDACGSKEL